jgi:predicted transcriptional regulator
MEVIFGRGEATVLEIQEDLPEAPTPMAIRRMTQILEEKGVVKRRKEGRGFVYLPRESREKAGGKALGRVLDTFFSGSLGDALATHLAKPGTSLSDEEMLRLEALIETARKEGR